MAFPEEFTEVLGFPVRVRGNVPLSAHGRRLNSRHTKRRPALTVVLVKHSSSVKIANPVSAMRGSTFQLDLKKSVLYLEPPASEQEWVRTVLFVLGLLAEHHGPAHIASKHSRELAPLLMHASAVQTPSGALVFCGHSTFGKTTIATKLLRGYPLINEDLNILLVGRCGKNSRKAVAYILVNDSGSPRRRRRRPAWQMVLLPVTGLFWLRKATCFKLESLGNAEAAANLLHPIFDLRQPENAKNRLKLIRMLLDACPCRRLCFRKERLGILQLLRIHGYL